MNREVIKPVKRPRRRNLIPHRGEVLLTMRTPYQKLEIQDRPDLGRCLFLDGRLQSSERYEHIYHESLVHPAMVLHPSPRRVFIAGGGEGATLREVLRHRTVECVTMVDIDEAVVRVSETYLQKWHRGAFSDPRVELIFADARAYLEKTEKKWDCIIVDVTDPILGGPSWSLFTKEFYQLAKTRVAQEGVFVQIVGMAETLSALNAVLRTLTTVFRFVTPYTINVGDFSGPWCFALASDHSHPRQLTGETVEAILKERGCFDLRAYGGRTHEAMFRPRSFGAIKLADGRIITDARPFFCD